MEKKIVASAADTGRRLDVFLAEKMPGESRALLQKHIAARRVLVNGAAAKPGARLKTGDIIAVDTVRAPSELEPNSSLDIPILFENEGFAVIDKPAGIAAHPIDLRGMGTVANWAIGRWPAVRGVGDSPLRPGIVHRLDRWTSGVMVIAKTQKMFEYLKAAFKERSVEKEYVALLEGGLARREGTVEGYLAPSKKDYRKKNFEPLRVSRKAKFSKTRFIVEQVIGNATLVRFFPETGRTHQLRAHAARLGHPIIGDRVYGAKRFSDTHGGRFFLHASRIAFTLPDGKRLSVSAETPQDFKVLAAGLQEAQR